MEPDEVIVTAGSTTKTVNAFANEMREVKVHVGSHRPTGPSRVWVDDVTIQLE